MSSDDFQSIPPLFSLSPYASKTCWVLYMQCLLSDTDYLEASLLDTPSKSWGIEHMVQFFPSSWRNQELEGFIPIWRCCARESVTTRGFA